MCVLNKAGIKTINWTLGITILWKVLMTNHYFPFHPLVFHLQTTHGALVSLKACHWPSCSNFAFGYTLDNFSWFLALTYRHTKERLDTLRDSFKKPRQSHWLNATCLQLRNRDDFANVSIWNIYLIMHFLTCMILAQVVPEYSSVNGVRAKMYPGIM